MCRLEHPLQVRRISLGQGQLLSERVERNSPGHRSLFSRDFEQAIEPAGNRIGERLIVRSTRASRCIRPRCWPGSAATIVTRASPGFRRCQYGKQGELFPVGQSASRDGDRGENGETSF